MKQPDWMPAAGTQGKAQLEGSSPNTSGTCTSTRPICCWVDVLNNQPAILAVEFLNGVAGGRLICAHTFTVGIVETKPFRVSVKSCLYSPRLILCVTLLT